MLQPKNQKEWENNLFLDQLIYPAQQKAYKINKDCKLCEDCRNFEQFKQKALVNEWLFDEDLRLLGSKVVDNKD